VAAPRGAAIHRPRQLCQAAVRHAGPVGARPHGAVHRPGYRHRTGAGSQHRLAVGSRICRQRGVRALILVPIVMTPVVVGLTWRFMFDPSSGMANYLLSVIGFGPVDWLGSTNVALFSLLI